MGVRAATGRGMAITSGDSATTVPLGWTLLAPAGLARATSTHSEESGIQASTAAGGFPVASSVAIVAAGIVCTTTAAQRPSTWGCSLLKDVASRWTAGAISPETATCAVVVWPAQVAWAEMVLAPRATRTVAAITAASSVSSAVLSLRLRPGRYRPPAPVRAVVTKSLTSRDAQPGPRVRAGAARAVGSHATAPPEWFSPATPPWVGQTRERCGHDCSRGSSPVRSLAPFAHDVLIVPTPVLRGGRPAAAPQPGQTGSMAGIVDVADPGDQR